MLRLRRRAAVFGIAASQSILIVAPILTWTGDTSDATPDFDVDLSSGLGAPRDTATNDVLRVQYSTDGGSNWNAYLTHSFTSGEIAGTPITVSGVSSLANAAYLFRARIERGGILSPWSSSAAATVTVTSDDNDYAAWIAAA